MNIELASGTYKSIKSLKWENIPDFVVITGKNGTGKTQLFELIQYELGTAQDYKQNISSRLGAPFLTFNFNNSSIYFINQSL